MSKRIFMVLAIVTTTAFANGDTPPPSSAPPSASVTKPVRECHSIYRLKNYEKAMSVCARDASSPEAQYYLGRMYEKGEGVESNFAVARGWYEKAAAGEYPDAQFRLAGAYARGIGGVPKDEAKAIELLTRAANNGSRRAQEYLATGYEKGLLGLPKSAEKAQYWRQRAEAKKQRK
jgi:TPR repeat protein